MGDEHLHDLAHFCGSPSNVSDVGFLCERLLGHRWNKWESDTIMTKRLILALLFSCSPLWATTYYVDNCVTVGSDRNDGTSTSTPWLTINKVNTSIFNPGDSILFEQTCTWYEQLTVKSSGSAGSPITFGAYGTGVLPIFDESAVVSTWTAVGVSYPNVWYATVAATPSAVFNNNVFATQAASEAALTEGHWFASGTTLYYYESAGNPSSQGYTITASIRNYGITTDNKTYLTIQNIQTQKANSFGILVGGTSSNVTVNGVKSYYNASFGIYIRGPSTGPAQTGITVTNSDVAYNGTSGIMVGVYTSNVEISHNTLHNNSQLPINFTGGYYSCSNGTSSNITVEYNESYSNGVLPPVGIGEGAGLWTDGYSTGVILRYNKIYGNVATGLFIEITSGAQAYGNVIYGNGTAGYNTRGLDVSAHTGTPASNNLIYNNTVYGNTTDGISVRSDESTSNMLVGNLVKNNISFGNAGAQLNVIAGGDNTGIWGSGNVYLYNDFGPAATDFINWGGAGEQSTYAAWETAAGNCGTVGCSHSVQANPQFVNAAGGNFTLSSTSPAINAGTNLGSTYEMGLDPGSSFSWTLVNQNLYGNWEVGSFVYVLPVALLNLRVLSVN